MHGDYGLYKIILRKNKNLNYSLIKLYNIFLYQYLLINKPI